MSRLLVIALVFLAVVAVIVLPACRGESELAKLAAKARAEGRTRVTVKDICEVGYSTGSLDEIVGPDISAYVVTGRGAPVTVATDNQIVSWHVVARERTLHEGSLGSRRCRTPAAVAVGPQELAIPSPAGSANVDGVEITVNSNLALRPFESGQRYLILGIRHPSGCLTLPQAQFNVFLVDSSDRLSAPPASFPPAFVADIITCLGTPDAVRNLLKGVVDPTCTLARPDGQT